MGNVPAAPRKDNRARPDVDLGRSFSKDLKIFVAHLNSPSDTHFSSLTSPLTPFPYTPSAFHYPNSIHITDPTLRWMSPITYLSYSRSPHSSKVNPALGRPEASEESSASQETDQVTSQETDPLTDTAMAKSSDKSLKMADTAPLTPTGSSGKKQPIGQTTPPAVHNTLKHAAASQTTLNTWSANDLSNAGLPLQGSRLTDADILTIVLSKLPTVERRAMYPGDFVQKGYPRRERAHQDPPGIIVSPNGHQCYAVVCGFYQLHGQEGEAKGLRDQAGTASVREPVTAGDVHDTIGYAGERKRSVDTRSSHPLDDADLRETSNSGAEDETTKDSGPATAYSELLGYAKQTDGLLTTALQLTREMAADRAKQPGAPTGFARRYNEIKGEWRAAAARAGDELMKEIRGG